MPLFPICLCCTLRITIQVLRKGKGNLRKGEGMWSLYNRRVKMNRKNKYTDKEWIGVNINLHYILI